MGSRIDSGTISVGNRSCVLFLLALVVGSRSIIDCHHLGRQEDRRVFGMNIWIKNGIRSLLFGFES